MSDARVVDLWARHLADVPLDADDQAELRAALARNDEFRAEAMRDLSFDRMLRARYRASQDAEAFEHALFRTLEAERDATRFLRKVNAKLQASGGRGDRPIPALVALAALLGLAILVAVPRAPSTPVVEAHAGTAVVETTRPVAVPDAEPHAPVGEPARPERSAAAEEDEAARAEREALEKKLAEARAREQQALDEMLRRAQDGAPPATEAACGRVETATGDAFVLTRRGRGVARIGEALAEGDSVQTGAGSASLAFADGARADLAARSRLRVERGRLVVVAGQLTLRAPGPFVVAAPHGDATGSGAALRVDVARTSTRVEVLEGRARFGEIDVPGGHVATAIGTREPVVRMRTPERVAYGCAQAAEAATSLPIGREPGAAVSIRFRAPYTAAVPEVRLVFACGKGESSGSGGEVRVELREDGRVLAAALVRKPRAQGERAVAFDRPATVEAGRAYELVLANPDTNPRDNWISLRTLGGGRSGSPIVHAVEIAYRSAHGRAFVGPGYAEASPPVAIAGAARVRERIAVRGEDVHVTSVSVCVRRVGRPGPLTVRLEEAGGAVVEEAAIEPKSGAWTTVPFARPRTLRAGKTYHVVLSAPAGDRYEIVALAPGVGFKSPEIFVDGVAQATEGAAWEDLDGRKDFDWPLHFGVAPR